jgi:hypothetical protein
MVHGQDFQMLNFKMTSQSPLSTCWIFQKNVRPTMVDTVTSSIKDTNPLPSIVVATTKKKSTVNNNRQRHHATSKGYRAAVVPKRKSLQKKIFLSSEPEQNEHNITMRRRHSTPIVKLWRWLWTLLTISGASASPAAATLSSSSSSSSASPRTSKTSRRAGSVTAADDDYDILSAPPISFTQAAAGGSQSLNKFLSTRWQKAVALAKLEQEVEDYNAAWIASANNPVQAISHRRLIALALLDEDGGTFDPPMGVFSHGHVQTGDKMSLPQNYWQSIALSKAQVPWLFSVSRIEGVTSPRVEIPGKDKSRISSSSSKESNDEKSDKEEEELLLSEYKPFRPLDSLVGGGLDFRSPSNYVSADECHH